MALIKKYLNRNVMTYQKSCVLVSTSHRWLSQTTVDKDEVDKHSAIRDEWWSPNGRLKVLHAMNDIRVPLVRDGLLGRNVILSPKPLEGFKLLDVGCGGGILSEPLARLGAQVTGLDASEELISVAKEHCKLNNTLSDNLLEYECSTIEDHAKTHPKYYDGVVASEIIEHVTDKELFVKSCIDSLKDGGSIFFTTPNKNWKTWFFGIIIAEFVLKTIPKHTHDYNKFIEPHDLARIVEKNNCKTKSLYGAIYNVISNKWSLTENKDFVYMLHSVKKS